MSEQTIRVSVPADEPQGLKNEGLRKHGTAETQYIDGRQILVEEKPGFVRVRNQRGGGQLYPADAVKIEEALTIRVSADSEKQAVSHPSVPRLGSWDRRRRGIVSAVYATHIQGRVWEITYSTDSP